MPIDEAALHHPPTDDALQPAKQKQRDEVRRVALGYPLGQQEEQERQEQQELPELPEQHEQQAPHEQQERHE